MFEDNNIKKYSASDIEKYWKGQLSPAEMHQLEKAAMDDPFLSDALEGYRYTSNATKDTVLLTQKLNERTSKENKVVPVYHLPWLRIAAVVIIIGGLGLLTQQLFFKPNKKEIAAVQKKGNLSTPEPAVTTKQKVNDSADKPFSLPEHKQSFTTNTTKSKAADGRVESNLSVKEKKYESVNPSILNTDIKNDEAKVATAPAPVEREPKKLAEASSDVIKAKTDSVILGNGANAEYKLEKGIFDKASTRNSDYISLYKNFNYRVVDAQHNPVPFANISIVQDSIGTYTDIKGNFNLISSDSVLDVQIKSLGYNAVNYRLRPSGKQEDILMQEDLKLRQEITTRNLNLVASRSKEESTEIEEPEVGWGNYNTYIQNNIKVPTDIRNKNTGREVELSFLVDNKGDPTDIRITKSLCNECDKEAIRLLKEGPKWKRKGKRGNTRVSIVVDRN